MRVQRPTETKRSGRTLAGNSSTPMTTTMMTAGLCFPDYLKKKKRHRRLLTGAITTAPKIGYRGSSLAISFNTPTRSADSIFVRRFTGGVEGKG